MSFSIKSQFTFCPLIWMFCSRTSMNKLNNIHEKCLRPVTNGYDSKFNELLESSHELSINNTCISYLMIEVHKYLQWQSPELMTDILTLRKNPHILSIHLFGSENPLSVHFGVDAIAFRASHMWQRVPIAIKDSSTLGIFKLKILWSCDDCPCNLCARFIANVGSI